MNKDGSVVGNVNKDGSISCDSFAVLLALKCMGPKVEMTPAGVVVGIFAVRDGAIDGVAVQAGATDTVREGLTTDGFAVRAGATDMVRAGLTHSGVTV